MGRHSRGSRPRTSPANAAATRPPPREPAAPRRRRLSPLLAGCVLAVVAVVVGTAMLTTRGAGTVTAADDSAPAPDSRYGKPPSPLGSTFYVNFGEIDPAGWPAGHSVREIGLGELTEEPAVQNGVLTQGEAISTSAARYFERAFDHPVHRIGVDVSFPAQWSGDSAMALVISDGPAPDFATSSARPNAGMHLVLTNREWELGVYPSDQPLDIIAHGVFETSTLTRALLRYEVRVSGDEVVVTLPDGLSSTVRDERVRRFAGNFAVWELFERGRGTGSPLIRAIWAQ